MNTLISTIKYKDFELMFHYISDDPRINDDCSFSIPVVSRPTFNIRIADLIRSNSILNRFVIKKEMRFRVKDSKTKVCFSPVFVVSFLSESVIPYMLSKKNAHLFYYDTVNYLKYLFSNIGSKSERDSFNKYINSTADKLLSLSEDELWVGFR
jgi:hypothetical protein